MTPEDIGKSVLLAFTVVVILLFIWPYLPKSGAFSGLTSLLSAAAEFIIPMLVIGPLAVAYYLLKDGGL